MITKTFEIRDRATCIAILAVRLVPTNPQDRYLLARTGYGPSAAEQGTYVVVWALEGGHGLASTDPWAWIGSRTRKVAHEFLLEHFDELTSGQVIDVEYLLGETPQPKRSEGDDGRAL